MSSNEISTLNSKIEGQELELKKEHEHQESLKTQLEDAKALGQNVKDEIDMLEKKENRLREKKQEAEDLASKLEKELQQVREQVGSQEFQQEDISQFAAETSNLSESLISERQRLAHAEAELRRAERSDAETRLRLHSIVGDGLLREYRAFKAFQESFCQRNSISAAAASIV